MHTKISPLTKVRRTVASISLGLAALVATAGPAHAWGGQQAAVEQAPLIGAQFRTDAPKSAPSGGAFRLQLQNQIYQQQARSQWAQQLATQQAWGSLFALLGS